MAYLHPDDFVNEEITFDKSKDPYWGTLILSILTLYNLYLIITSQGGGIGFTFFYVIGIINGFNSEIVSYLKNIHVTEGITSYIQQLKNTRPTIHLHGSAYHKEIVYSDEDDDYGSEQTVNTYTVKEILVYDRVEDASSTLLDDIYNYNLLKMNFDVYWTCGDEKTLAHYESLKSKVINRVRGKDDEWSYYSSIALHGYQPSILALSNLHNKSRFLDLKWYFVSIFFLLSWPYKVWVERKSVKSYFQFRKKIYIE